MKLINYHIISIFIATGIIFTPAYADSLGRLFTSPVERKQLDKIRLAKEKPKKVDVVQVEEFITPIEIEEEIVIRDAIRLKGIVHRSDGKNVAWINDSNTYEGDLESLYIQIKTEEIEPDQVQLTMPYNKTKVKIKVGDYYDPQNKDDN